MRCKPNTSQGSKFFLSCFFLLALAINLHAQEIYNSQKETIEKMTPEEVVRTVKLPDGFSIRVAASEPDVQQPIAMAWDPLGRLWIAENYTYAESAIRVDDKLSDRIVVLEDQDKDGVFEKRKVFAEGLKGLTSIELSGPMIKRGVWALAPPYLLYIPDRDGDDVADSKPVVVLRGFNKDIRHNFANGLRFGPDGWLYGRHGILGSSEVSVPTKGQTPPGFTPPKATLNCGVWRFNFLTERLEMVCEGTTNPWGMDWDDHGNLFFINTVIGHLWQAIPNAHLQRMYGEDSDPYAYELLPQIADHVHWDSSTEDWRETRKGPPSSGTDAAGGGHAHSGLMIYQADQWPEEYRGNVFALNLHGRRINRDFLKPAGSSFVASHGPDMVFWQDPWFRGLDITQAPDGSAVVIDWSDIGECHDDDGVHRTSGRIYRLSYENNSQTPYEDLMKVLARLYQFRSQTDPYFAGPEAVAVVSHPNVWFTQQLIKLAVPNHQIQNLEPLIELATQAPKDFNNPARRFEVTKQLRALWVLNACRAIDTKGLLSILRNKQHESVHVWASKLLLDRLQPAKSTNNTGGLRLTPSENDPSLEIESEILDCLYAQSRPKASAQFRLMLASQLPKFTDKFEPILKVLLKSDDLAEDLTFCLVLWYGIKDRVAEEPLEMSKLVLTSELRKVQELLVRRLAAMLIEKSGDTLLADQGLSFLLADAVQRDIPKLHGAILRGFWGAYQGRSQAAKPPYWSELSDIGAKHPDPALRRTTILLGAIFDQAQDLQPLLQVISDPSVPLVERKSAVEAIGGIDSLEAIDQLRGLFADPDLGNAAAYALRRTLSKSRAKELVDSFSKAPEPARRGIVSALASRVDTLDILLDAIDQQQIPKDAIDASSWRQFLSAKDWQLLERARKYTSSLDLPENRKDMIEKEEAILTPEVIVKANANSGRAIWVAKCGNCHKLYGEGGQIGPELTGAQRTNLRYWLENILAPAAVVAENYRSTAFRTLDGRVITGVVLSETKNEVTVQTAQDKVILQTSEIEDRTASQFSLMPEGLFDGLSQESKANLLKYLMSSPQELSK
jgi:putative membrane-bound dehydrogenase-like protein